MKQIKPVLVYDGNCEICCYWVNYWRSFTGKTVEYHPYQNVARQYPAISEEQFRKSVQLIAGEKIYTGAHAVYVLLQAHFPYNIYLWLYHYLPGFAFITEWFYTFFSKRRGLLKFSSYLLWGKNHERARYELLTWLFLRLLGIIYLAAFASLAIQINGLVGNDGILPLGIYLENIYSYFGNAAFYKFPTLFWIDDSDIFLSGCCYAGIVFSLLLICNVLTRISLFLLFILWLSLYYAGQIFLQFQWDLLLLESGFLAIFLQTRSSIIIWLFRWLVFRFMFLGGLVKIASGDPTWDNLTALLYHFETQPLPTSLAWYVHHLPDSALKLFTGATLLIEIVLPFFIFLTRNFRYTAATGFFLLQTAILLTGNYNYFNLLTIIICLFLIDDHAIRRFFPNYHAEYVINRQKTVSRNRLNLFFTFTLAVILVSASVAQLWSLFNTNQIPVLTTIAKTISPLNIVNNYGPFAVMSTVRNEIIIEGSNDKKIWKAYLFKYKPDIPDKKPQWIIPHQPRLDWQMWFAALGNADNNPWFKNLLYRLLQNSPSVTKLLAYNPFPNQPPKYIRSLMYEYHFSNQELKKDGIWWTRNFRSIYLNSATLPTN